MSVSYRSSIGLPHIMLWKKIKDKRIPLSFDLELTARCNNNCRHCYINLSDSDKQAQDRELSSGEIKDIVDEAVSMGSLWCLMTGGEPLLRDDFFDIYLYLKKKGLLVSVFTNATLITKEHVRLFKKFPPRDIEVSVYGVSNKTYELVTRRRGSFDAFMRGIDLLLNNNIKVRFKAMALRSNVHELPEIASFCQNRTKDYFRFDPFLHCRFDCNISRNEEIISERLTPEEIVVLEHSDPERFQTLEKICDKLIIPEFSHTTCNHLFHCSAGNSNFTLGYDGIFRLCSSLFHPDCVYDLRKGNFTDAWYNFVPQVRDMRSDRKEFLEKCRVCPLINLCTWCPAHAYLETEELDTPVDYFCKVAHARAKALKALKT
ncbi:MAG: hypothetical protein AYK18_08735 [Theionarchaea archaeon DG-70]|nr:MAG: hypothetical protein AYK18_08735 [Theionarchaea archaeon DG-70]